MGDLVNRSKLLPLIFLFLSPLAFSFTVETYYYTIGITQASQACSAHKVANGHPSGCSSFSDGTYNGVRYCDASFISNGDPWATSSCADISASLQAHAEYRFMYAPECPSGTEPDPTTGECQAPPPSCDLPDDYQTRLSFDNWYLPSTQCVSDCRLYLGGVAVITGSGITVGSYHNTGEQCTGSEGVTNTISDGGGSSAPEPTNNCPAGYVESSMGCIAQAPDEEEPTNCPVGYFPDAEGRCWLDIDGTETGNAPSPTGPYTGGPTSTAPGSATGSTGGSQGEGGGTQTGGQYSPGDEPTDPTGSPGSAGGRIGTGSGDDEGTGQGSGAASGSCEQAPTSQGDAQLDAILRQQWETMCRGHNATVSGTGDCVSEFQCDGDPMQCIQLEYQRMQTCSVRDASLAEQGIENALGGKGLKSVDDVIQAREGQGYEYDSEVDLSTEMDIYTGETSGSCPSDYTLSLLGSQITIPISQFCALLGWIGIFVRIAASVLSFHMIFNTLRAI